MQRIEQRLAALTLAATATFALLLATNQIATSAPPAALVAQMEQAAHRG